MSLCPSAFVMSDKPSRENPGPRGKKEWVPRVRVQSRDARDSGYLKEDKSKELDEARGIADALRERIKDLEGLETKKAEAKAKALAQEADTYDDIVARVENMDVAVNKYDAGWFSDADLKVPITQRILYGKDAEGHRLRYQFQYWATDDDLEQYDVRPLAMTTVDQKYKSRCAWFRVTELKKGWFWDTQRHRMMLVSLEAICHLMSPDVVAVWMDPGVVLDRLKIASRRLAAVQENRYRYLEGDTPIANAVYVAYALYLEEKESLEPLNLLCPPAFQRTW